MVKLAVQKAASGEDRQLIPDNTPFEAKVLSVEERDSYFWVDKDDHSQGKQKELNFKFSIIDPGGDNNNRWVWGSTSNYISTGTQNKLRRWVIAILDLDVLDEGFVLDTEDLVGRQCRIVVEQWVSDKIDPETGENKRGNSVGEVRPSKEVRGGGQPAAPAQTVESFRQENKPAPNYDDEPF